MKAVGQLLIILSLSGWLMGCSTVEGIGKDLKKVVKPSRKPHVNNPALPSADPCLVCTASN